MALTWTFAVADMCNADIAVSEIDQLRHSPSVNKAGHGVDVVGFLPAGGFEVGSFPSPGCNGQTTESVVPHIKPWNIQGHACDSCRYSGQHCVSRTDKDWPSEHHPHSRRQRRSPLRCQVLIGGHRFSDDTLGHVEAPVQMHQTEWEVQNIDNPCPAKPGSFDAQDSYDFPTQFCCLGVHSPPERTLQFCSIRATASVGFDPNSTCSISDSPSPAKPGRTVCRTHFSSVQHGSIRMQCAAARARQASAILVHNPFVHICRSTRVRSPSQATAEGRAPSGQEFSLCLLQRQDNVGNLIPHNLKEPDEPDEVSGMQLPSIYPPAGSPVSSLSSIPEDWYIDLQRRVAELEAICQTDHPEELLFTVYTWFLDHATETKSSEAKLATLGGYPPDWESDILFPWHDKLIPGERVHIDMVHPIMTQLSTQEHIAHVIVSQRRTTRMSTLLVVELQYPRPMIFRAALALHSPCTRQEILQLSPIATEYADILKWHHPKLAPHEESFPTRDGMGIQLLVDPAEIAIEDPDDHASFMQPPAAMYQHPRAGDHLGENFQQTPHPAFSQYYVGQVPGSQESCAHALDLPPAHEEPAHYQFNINAPEFVPGAPVIEGQSEFVQDLHHARNLAAFNWQDQAARITYVITWFVDHRFHFPICDASRRVTLDHHFQQWEQQILATWNDLIVPGLVVEMYHVMPAPPRLEPGVFAHAILVQSPRPEWESSLVSVDDDVFTRINDGVLIRLVITTFEHFTIEQVVQICGYPTTCTWAMQALRCFAWIQQQQLLPGRLWPGRPGTSIHLSIIRTPSVVANPVHEQLNRGNPMMYQKYTRVTKKLPIPANGVSKHLSPIISTVHHGDAVGDESILMAQGVRQRRRSSPVGSVSDLEHAVRQHEEVDLPHESSDSESSSSDPNWQETVLFSPVCEPVTRQLLIPSARTRRYQIARAFGWDPNIVDFEVLVHTRPSDLLERHLYARLVGRVDDLPTNSNLQLVLIDVVFHPQPPSWESSTVRKAMYVLPTLTVRQFIKAMFLQRYCNHGRLPCIVLHNQVVWPQDQNRAHDIHTGDYFVFHVPPPSQEIGSLPTRCVAVAMHQGIDLAVVELLGDLPDQEMSTVPNPYQIMLDQDADSDTEEISMLQKGLVIIPISGSRPLASIRIKPVGAPRMRTTLGDHDVLLTSQVNEVAAQSGYLSLHHCVWLNKIVRRQNFPLQVPTSPKSQCNAMKPICSHRWLPYNQCQRLGEAAVPGPSPGSDPPTKWAIGAINPTGLAGKAVLFEDLPQGIYAISETHLTSRGRVRFNQELWYAKSPFTLTTGADAPYKKANMRAVGGKHTGVGFLSSYPARTIRLGWDQELYKQVGSMLPLSKSITSALRVLSVMDMPMPQTHELPRILQINCWLSSHLR